MFAKFGAADVEEAVFSELFISAARSAASHIIAMNTEQIRSTPLP